MNTTTLRTTLRKSIGLTAFALIGGGLLCLLPGALQAQQTKAWRWGNSGAGITVASSCSEPAIDQAENVYVIGRFKSDNEAMKFSNSTVTLSVFNPGITTIFIAKYDKNGNFKWAKSFKSGMADGAEIGVDNGGNIYCTGVYRDSIKIDNTTLNANSNLYTPFLAKFTTDGNLVWAQNLTTAANGHYIDYNALEVSAQGRVFLGGSYNQSNLSFGNVSVANSDGSGNSYDFFVVEFNGDGDAVWSRSNGTPNHNDFPVALSLNTAGELYAGTSYQDTGVVMYGGQVKIYKYNNNGDVVWNATGNSNNGVSLGDITNDNNGNLYIAGGYSGNAQFGNVTLNEDNGGSYVVKYDHLGNIAWIKTSKTSESDISVFVTGIGVDQSGNVSIGGSYVYSFLSPVSSITFDSTMLTMQGNRDAFLAQYNSSGKMLNAQNISGTLSEFSSGLNVAPNGNVYYSGSFYSPSVTLDSVTLTNAPDGGNYYGKFFIAKYSENQVSGIGGRNNDLVLNLYPNPSNGIFTIEASTGIKAVKITDQLGRQLYSRSFTHAVQQYQADISFLAKGQYRVQVYTDKGYVVKVVTLN